MQFFCSFPADAFISRSVAERVTNPLDDHFEVFVEEIAASHMPGDPVHEQIDDKQYDDRVEDPPQEQPAEIHDEVEHGLFCPADAEIEQRKHREESVFIEIQQADLDAGTA